jgi:integrating conjugative element protein (TIGR03765 family)
MINFVAIRLILGFGITILIGSTFTAHALADKQSLITIGTVGHVEPAAKYYRNIRLPERHILSLPTTIPPAPSPSLNTRFQQWPLHSSLLTFGQPAIIAPPQTAVLPAPIFVIGTDRDSLRWIAETRRFLMEKKAIGFVVEVSDEAAWQRLHEIADGLPLYPIPGDTLATELGIKHYPVLLMR